MSRFVALEELTERAMRSALLPLLVVALTGVLVGACSMAAGPPVTDIPPGGTGAPGSSEDPAVTATLHREAEADLARWAAAVNAARSDAFQPTDQLVGQIGTWEPVVGDNNKPALYAGMVDLAVQLPTTPPPNGVIRWRNGSTASMPLLSASQALNAIKATADDSCPTCTPLVVTGARLTSGPLETTRGPAIVPIWSFALKGTSVQVTRVAVAEPLEVVPPPWDPSNPPTGVSIEAASVSADGQSLTVGFVGAQDTASKPCGEDYTAEAVESDLAVVVIIHVHQFAAPYPSSAFPMVCDLVGFVRSAVVHLASPLRSRAVLEVNQGLPVPVTGP